MKCPYCSKEMEKGFIRNARDSVRWYPEETDTSGFWPEHEGSVLLAKLSWVTGAEAESWYCPDCRMVITPVPEIEASMDKLKKKWESFTQRLGEESDKRREEREAEKQKKEREKMRKRDPWEV